MRTTRRIVHGPLAFIGTALLAEQGVASTYKQGSYQNGGVPLFSSRLLASLHVEEVDAAPHTAPAH